MDITFGSTHGTGQSGNQLAYEVGTVIDLLHTRAGHTDKEQISVRAYGHMSTSKLGATQRLDVTALRMPVERKKKKKVL